MLAIRSEELRRELGIRRVKEHGIAMEMPLEYVLDEETWKGFVGAPQHREKPIEGLKSIRLAPFFLEDEVTLTLTRDLTLTPDLGLTQPQPQFLS